MWQPKQRVLRAIELHRRVQNLYSTVLNLSLKWWIYGHKLASTADDTVIHSGPSCCIFTTCSMLIQIKVHWSYLKSSFPVERNGKAINPFHTSPKKQEKYLLKKKNSTLYYCSLQNMFHFHGHCAPSNLHAITTWGQYHTDIWIDSTWSRLSLNKPR